MNIERNARLAGLGFDVERQRLAREYKGRRFGLSLARILAYIAVSGWMLTGFTFELKAWANTFGPGPVAIAAYTLAVYFVYWLPVIPVGVYGALGVERKFGLSVQGFRSWLVDAAKGLAIGLAFAVVIVEVLYALLAVFPDRWWLVAWALGLGFGVVLSWVGPVLLAPLFYRFEPLADTDLAARLRKLARKAGTGVVGVYRMVASAKTTRAIGGLAGVGNTRRIILSDTLLNHYTPEEIETVIAHELGHHTHRDIARLTVAAAVTSLIGLLAVDRILRAAVPAIGLAGISDIAGLPLLGLAVAMVSTLLTPLLNVLSRQREARADDFALRMTGNRAALATTLVKIHDQNLGVADPHPLVELLFHDHPSGLRRVEAVTRKRG